MTGAKFALFAIASFGILCQENWPSARAETTAVLDHISRQKCGVEVDLGRKGQSMANVPVFSQGDTGTCYAHACASVLTAYLQSHGDRKPDEIISPVDAAMQEIVDHNQYDRKHPQAGVPHKPKTYSETAEKDDGRDVSLAPVLAGGDPCMVFFVLQQRGVCDYKAAKALQNRVVKDGDGKPETFLKAMKGLFFEMWENNPSKKKGSVSKYQDAKRNLNYLVANRACPEDRHLPQMPQCILDLDAHVREITARTEKDSLEPKMEFLAEALDAACKPRKKIASNLTCNYVDEVINPFINIPT